MNITARTCATCASFDPAKIADGETCRNGVTITERKGSATELHRQPVRGDWCDSHISAAEDATESALIELHRKEGGLAQAMQAMESISHTFEVIRQAQR